MAEWLQNSPLYHCPTSRACLIAIYWVKITQIVPSSSSTFSAPCLFGRWVLRWFIKNLCFCRAQPWCAEIFKDLQRHGCWHEDKVLSLNLESYICLLSSCRHADMFQCKLLEFIVHVLRQINVLFSHWFICTRAYKTSLHFWTRCLHNQHFEHNAVDGIAMQLFWTKETVYITVLRNTWE